MKRQCLVAFLVFAFVNMNVHAEAVPPDPLTLDWTVREVLRVYPEVGAKHRALDAAQARVAPAGALADPSVGVMWDRARSGADRETMFELSQPLPFPGKRRLRTDVARQDAAAAEVELFAHHLEVQAQAQKAYLGYWAAAERTRILQDQRRLFAAYAPAVRARGVRNLAAPRDLAIDVARLDADIARAQQQYAAARMQLNVLLARPVAAPLPPAGAPEAIAVPALDALLAHADTALASREARTRLARAEAQWRLARRERAPDFTVFGRYTAAENGVDDRVRLGLSMNLPLWAARKQAAEVTAAGAERARWQEQQRATAQAVLRDIQIRFDALQAERTALEVIERDVLPRTAQLVQIATGAYQSGRADVLQFLEAREREYAARLDALERRIAVTEARIALEQTAGLLPEDYAPAVAGSGGKNED